MHEQKFESNYKATGGNKTFPWATIIQAIMALLPAICPAKGVKRWAKNHPEAAKEAINNAIKNNGIAMSTKDRGLVVDSAYETFLKLSNDEIEELRDA